MEEYVRKGGGRVRRANGNAAGYVLAIVAEKALPKSRDSRSSSSRPGCRCTARTRPPPSEPQPTPLPPAREEVPGPPNDDHTRSSQGTTMRPQTTRQPMTPTYCSDERRMASGMRYDPRLTRHAEGIRSDCRANVASAGPALSEGGGRISSIKSMLKLVQWRSGGGEWGREIGVAHACDSSACPTTTCPGAEKK